MSPTVLTNINKDVFVRVKVVETSFRLSRQTACRCDMKQHKNQRDNIVFETMSMGSWKIWRHEAACSNHSNRGSSCHPPVDKNAMRCSILLDKHNVSMADITMQQFNRLASVIELSTSESTALTDWTSRLEWRCSPIGCRTRYPISSFSKYETTSGIWLIVFCFNSFNTSFSLASSDAWWILIANSSIFRQHYACAHLMWLFTCHTTHTRTCTTLS